MPLYRDLQQFRSVDRSDRKPAFYLYRDLPGTIDNSTSIDYEQLYAQAVAALKNGERYWFTSEEEFSTTRNNEVFQQLPVEEQLFLQYFRAARPGEERVWNYPPLKFSSICKVKVALSWAING